MVILAVCMIPLSAWSSEGDANKDQPSPWRDIKSSANVKPIVPNIPEKYKELEKVFNAYWSALKDRDFQKAYAMESSEYRKKTSLDLYTHLKDNTVTIIAVRPLEVRPITEEKEVMVRASFSFKAGFLDTVHFISDRWIKETDGWKHVQEDSKS